MWLSISIKVLAAMYQQRRSSGKLSAAQYRRRNIGGKSAAE